MMIAKAVGVTRRMWTNVVLDWEYLTHTHDTRGARLRFVGRKYAAILRGKRSVPWFGARFAYDNVWTPALLQGYPKDLTDLFDAAPGLPADPTVLDVGANCGQFAATVIGLRPRARVWSLEPNEAVLGTLRDNAGRHPEWQVVPFGCAETHERRTFFFVPGKSSQGSVFARNATLGLLGGEAVETTVEVRPLDDETRALHDIPRTFDLVKIDVEGAEQDVLAGLRGVEWRYLMVEASLDRDGGITRDDLLGLVRASWGDAVRIATVLSSSGSTEELLFERGQDLQEVDPAR